MRIAAAAIALSILRCATGPAVVSERAAAAHRPRPISGEAAALFARADQPGAGASLVLDFEVMRELGFLSGERAPKESPLTDLLVAIAAGVAGETTEAATLAARAAVVLGLVRDWAEWPQARRLAVMGPAPGPRMAPGQFLEQALAVLAVDAAEASNTELLQGLAALARVAGAAPMFKAEGGRICVEGPQLPMPICARGGPGYIAFGSAATLQSLAAPATPAALPTAAGPLLRLRMAMPAAGKAELTVSRDQGLLVTAAMQAENPMLPVRLEQVLTEWLRKLDEHRARGREQVGLALESMRKTVAADAEAPPGLKAAAARLTLEQLLDREGTFAAVRKSVVVARAGGSLSAEVRFPERLVREVARGGGLAPGVMAIGAMAAIAIPNFVKFSCRSKQSEARANLKAAYTAYRAFQIEHNRAGRSFEELGFRPGAGRRYSYCMAGDCLPCDRPGCRAPDADNPCARPLAAGALFCAAGEAAGGKADVWILGPNGEEENVANGCN